MAKSMALAFGTLIMLSDADVARADAFVPAKQFRIDGIPVACGNSGVLITEGAPGVAFFDGRAIIVNPKIFFPLPTFLKLFIYAHECGHGIFGGSEDAADCFAAKIGRDQGWFPPDAFRLLVAQLESSTGDWTHRPGPQRLERISACYTNRP